MNANERKIIFPITIGGILEWYEVYQFIYWAPIISKSYFDLSLSLTELSHAFLILFIGFLSRPIGGLIFGYFGDKLGRKKSFMLTILLVAFPSFLITLMPDISSWAFFSMIYLAIMRFFQGIPAGGELPGALCYLYESAKPSRRKYLCSYLFVGPQIGQLISMVQILLFEELLTHEQLVTWGWRLSFFIGGMIGVSGFFIRKKLEESSSFEHLKEVHHVLKNPIKKSFLYHKKDIIQGILISVFEVVGFFLLAFFLVENSQEILNLNIKETLTLYFLVLLFITFMMPTLGYLGERLNTNYILSLSAFLTIILSLPLYLSISIENALLSSIFVVLLATVLIIQFSFLPSILAELYPTSVRYTCLGFSFNIADSVIGGLSPLVATLITYKTGNSAAFTVMLPISALIFLLTLPFIKRKKTSTL